VLEDVKLPSFKTNLNAPLSFYSRGDKVRVKYQGILETVTICDTNGFVLHMYFNDDSYLILRTGDPRISYWYSNESHKWLAVNTSEVDSSVNEMSVDEVHVFVRTICSGAFAFYADVFRDNEIDGFELLRLENESLAELGIIQREMQQKFLTQIQMKLDAESYGEVESPRCATQKHAAVSKGSEVEHMGSFQQGLLSIVEQDIHGNGVTTDFVRKQARLRGLQESHCQGIDDTLKKFVDVDLLMKREGKYSPTYNHLNVGSHEPIAGSSSIKSQESDLTASDLLNMVTNRLKMEQNEHQNQLLTMSRTNTELRNQVAHVVRSLRMAKEELQLSQRRNETLNSEINLLQEKQRKHKEELQKMEFELLMEQRQFEATRIRLDQELQHSKGENLSKVSEETLEELLAQTQQSAARITTELDRRRSEPPSEFFCPILHRVMEDPVMAVDGFTYERSSILRWFSEHNTSPLTNLPLDDLSLRPNQALLSLIHDFQRRERHRGNKV